MHAKLQINRSLASLDDFCEATRNVVDGSPFIMRVNIIMFLYLRCDRGIRRKDFAAQYFISRRTLNRWIRRFNAGGIAGLLESPCKRRGRKPKVKWKDFDDRILPVVEQATKSSGETVTVKTLFRSARKLGLFPASYSTFRRCLGGLPQKYRKQRIEPTFHEYMFFVRTRRWPRHLKVFARRQARQQQRARQRVRESLQQDAQAEHQ